MQLQYPGAPVAIDTVLRKSGGDRAVQDRVQVSPSKVFNDIFWLVLDSPNGALESCDCFVSGGQWMGKRLLVVLMRARRAR